MGVSALQNNTIGSSNTAIGTQALLNNTADNNTAVGYQALFSNTTGIYNTAVEFQALYSQTEGQFDTAFGAQALYSYNSTAIVPDNLASVRVRLRALREANRTQPSGTPASLILGMMVIL